MVLSIELPEVVNAVSWSIVSQLSSSSPRELVALVTSESGYTGE